MRCSCLAILVFFVLCWIHVKAESIIKRGTATMMSFSDVEDSHALNKRARRPFFRGTWYSGKDLKNAACYDRKGLPKFSARVDDMIGAMAMRNFEFCYKCMKITNRKNNHSIEVKIVDKCAACKVGAAIDLTPGAFKQLNPEGLSDGVLQITWEVVPCTVHLNIG